MAGLTRPSSTASSRLRARRNASSRRCLLRKRGAAEERQEAPTPAELLELDEGQTALFEAHARLAGAVARRFSRPWNRALQDELRQEALLGLAKAALEFDPGAGVPFEAFAWTRMKWEAHRFLVPRSEGQPSPRRGKPTMSAQDMRSARRREVLWSEPASPDGEVTKGDRAEALQARREVQSEPGTDALHSRLFEVREALGEAGLSANEREVLRLRFEEGLTIEQASARLGFGNPDSASTLTHRAVAKLREHMLRREKIQTR